MQNRYLFFVVLFWRSFLLNNYQLSQLRFFFQKNNSIWGYWRSFFWEITYLKYISRVSRLESNKKYWIKIIEWKLLNKYFNPYYIKINIKIPEIQNEIIDFLFLEHGEDNKPSTSLKSMFNVATFWEMLLPSLANVSNHVAQIYRKYEANIRTWTETVQLASLNEKKLLNATN